MRRLAPLLALALLAGCSTRERANPFDPNNPNTSGRPFGFVALAENGRVRLRWQRVEGGTLIGYQLFRRRPTESQFIQIGGVLSVNDTQFLDFPLTNGLDYSYRLYFVFPSGLGARPAEDIAMPAQVTPWLIEADGFALVQITADGRRVAGRSGGFGGTNDVAVNVADGMVWVSDPGGDKVVVYNPFSGVRTTIPVTQPSAIAVDSFDGSGWVCDLATDQVLHFRPQGDPATEPITNLDTPVDAAVDVEDGSVWVCERGANRVGRYDRSANPITQRAVSAPSRVAVDSVTRTAWVTSFARGTITRIDFSGFVIDTLDLFVTPLGIAVDARRGRIWVADPGVGEVIALRRDGTVEFRLPGFPDAGELSLDARTGEVWVVLANPGELVQITATGAVRRRLGGLDLPISVAVDPGP